MALPVLLVHGSFHTGACWDMVLPHLAERGLDARAMTLSGHYGNARSPWRVDMETYGTDVIKAAEAIGMPCLLVGHSMGGLVISVAAERRPDLFAGMVYLSAFVPKIGRSSLLNLGPPSSAMRNGMKLSILRGVLTMPPDVARQIFYNCCEREVQEQALALLCPQPTRACMSPIKATAARLGSVPKHYVECLHDEALPLSSQRAMQAQMPFESVHMIDSDHSPFFCRPAELADLIEQLSKVA